MKNLIREDMFVDMKQIPFFIRPLLPEKNRDRVEKDPHRHTYHEIIYFKDGNALQNIDDEFVNLQTKNTFYLIGRGQVHDFIKGKNMKGYLIRFDTDLIPFQNGADNIPLLSLIDFISKVNIIVLDKENAIEFESILEKFY